MSVAMIINLRTTKNKNGTPIINFPKITFDRRFNYKVGITHINYKIDATKESLEDNELVCIVSNLVDLAANNTHQTIGHFAYNGRKPIQNVKPAIVQYQPLQLFELEHASFEIRRLFKNDTIQIENLFLQIEILRLDAYGRIQ